LRDFWRRSIFDFCNNIGTERTWRDVRVDSAMRAIPDIGGQRYPFRLPMVTVSAHMLPTLPSRDVCLSGQTVSGLITVKRRFDPDCRRLGIFMFGAHVVARDGGPV
jgi:hypothetical protein